MDIILASASVFRKKALDLLGLQYAIIPSNINEKAIRDSNPLNMAQKLSEAKAKAIGENHPDKIVIAADLFVVQNKTVFEKPTNKEDAINMLRQFPGKKIVIITGLAVFNSNTQKMLSTAESCNVTFRNLEEREISDYVARYPVTNFAGAFDGDGLLRFAEHIQGNYNFHAALPMNRLVEFLRENELAV